MRVTLQDVAKAAGLATSTVSRALRGSLEISEQTRTRVREIAMELGYIAGRSPASPGAFKQLLVVTESPENNLPDPHQNVLSGVQAYTGAHDIGVTLVGKNFVRQQSGINAALRTVSGALFIMPSTHSPLIDQCRAHGLPIAVANRSSNQVSNQDVDITVHSDEQMVAELVVGHLVKNGHRSVGFVSFAHSNCMMHTRAEALKRALENHELQVRPEWFFMRALKATKNFIDVCHDPIGPTAIVCASDSVALIVVHMLRESGLDIPQDISITGVHNLEFVQFLSPPLTTVDIGLREIGFETARQICEYASGNGKRRKIDISFTPHLIERKSVSKV